MRFSRDDWQLIQEQRGYMLASFADRYDQEKIDALEARLAPILTKEFKGHDVGEMMLVFSQLLDRLVYDTLKKAREIDQPKIWNPSRKH